MSRPLIVIAVVLGIAAALGAVAAATVGHAARHHLPAATTIAPSSPFLTFPARPGGAAAPAAPPAALTAGQVRATAVAFVTALWSRPPGAGPFEWLGQVADITAPDLAAGLRTAQPTVDDDATLSETVDIDGVYPSALDADTVTVTCVAHLDTTAGPVDQPCATTVTVAPGPDGRPVVTAVQ